MEKIGTGRIFLVLVSLLVVIYTVGLILASQVQTDLFINCLCEYLLKDLRFMKTLKYCIANSEHAYILCMLPRVCVNERIRRLI